MATYNNALTNQPANRLAFPSSIGPVPRNEYLGALSDFLAKSYSPERTQQMQGISELLGLPAVSRTLDMMSYGDPLTTGAGGLGGTTRVKPDVLEAAMTVAPLGKPATMATLQAARLARQAAMETGKFVAPKAGQLAEQYMVKMGGILPLDVYHGSPHRLPPTARNPLGEFDASKIGTGEGAQVYGHGIYTAENPAVATGYRDKLQKVTYSGNEIDPANPSHVALATVEQFGDRQKASAYLKQRANLMDYEVNMQAAKLLDDGSTLPTRTATGNLYKVDLPDEMIPKMLDYDKHLSDQSLEVQKILLPYQKEIGSSFGTGQQTLKAIAFERRMKGLDDSPAAVAQQLREMGIPGIKYFDAQSRPMPNITNSRLAELYAKNEGNAEAAVDEFMRSVYNTPKKKAEMRKQFLKELETPKTRNFVTFPGEEKNLTILERNGQKATRTNNLTRK
jgi:hypothetical protein